MNKSMKKALVDVPVAIYPFVRPALCRKVFAQIKAARPSKLFIISDGPRNERERELVRESRDIFNGIDWECEVHKLYFDDNLGMFERGREAGKYIWSHADRCIFLEDDVVVSVSFFKFCAELLEKYKDDLRIHYISGLNYLGQYDEPEADYFFGYEAAIWGFAVWKRTIDMYTYQTSDKEKKYMIDRVRRLINKDMPGHWGYVSRYIETNNSAHASSTEFYKTFLCFAQHSLAIIPKINMVSNIGIGEGSAHSSDKLGKLPRAVQKLFNMKIYELPDDRPIIHPKFVIQDCLYDERARKINGFGHPVKNFFNKIERGLRCLVYGDFKKLFSGTKRYLLRLPPD